MDVHALFQGTSCWHLSREQWQSCLKCDHFAKPIEQRNSFFAHLLKHNDDKKMQMSSAVQSALATSIAPHLARCVTAKVETLTETSLKRMHLQFERKVKVNRELRIKHVDDPDKFLKSEVDLDEEIKKHLGVACRMVKLEGVDKLLRGIAAYRKRDPADSEDRHCKLELMIRMMREKVFAATLALKLVDHSLRHCPENCPSLN
eukprot:Skav236094  [mRNA]  locus=scaffold1166:118020:122160:+ [translate_table: standard]